MRLIVGMTGATGAPLGVRLLEVLRDLADVETHLVMSRWARTTIELETAYSVREVGKLVDVVYGPGDQAAAISSGSFLTAGMVIVPCSMKTLAGIRTGYADGLIARAADVCLKERRRLVLVLRETPLSDDHDASTPRSARGSRPAPDQDHPLRRPAHLLTTTTLEESPCPWRSCPSGKAGRPRPSAR